MAKNAVMAFGSGYNTIFLDQIPYINPYPFQNTAWPGEVHLGIDPGLQQAGGNAAGGTVDWNSWPPPHVNPKIDLETLQNIDLKIGGDMLTISREEFLKALLKSVPGLVEKYAAARLVEGTV